MSSGTDVPAAIDSFADVSMTPLMKGNIELARYDRPTPVQKNSIPVITARRDLMSCAHEGQHRAGPLRPTNSCAKELNPSHHCQTRSDVVRPDWIREDGRVLDSYIEQDLRGRPVCST